MSATDDPRDSPEGRRAGSVDEGRDAWLAEALRHAPDADAAPPVALREAILAEARSAAAADAGAPVPGASQPPQQRAQQPRRSRQSQQPTWRARALGWWSALARPPVAAGFASVMVAVLVGVMWADRPLDDALPRSPIPAPPQAAPAETAGAKAESPPAGPTTATKPATAPAATPAPAAAPAPAVVARPQTSVPAELRAAATPTTPLRSQAAPPAATRSREAETAAAADQASLAKQVPARPSLLERSNDAAPAANTIAEVGRLRGDARADAADPASRKSDAPAVAQPFPASPPAAAAPAAPAAPAAKPAESIDRAARDESKSIAQASPGARRESEPRAEESQRQAVNDRAKERRADAPARPEAFAAAPSRRAEADIAAAAPRGIAANAELRPLAPLLASLDDPNVRWTRDAGGDRSADIDAPLRSWLARLDTATAGRWQPQPAAGAGAAVDAVGAAATTVELRRDGRSAATIRVDAGGVSIRSADGTCHFAPLAAARSAALRSALPPPR